MLDEPFGLWMPSRGKNYGEFFQQLLDERTVHRILVTHDLREAVFLANTVHVMSRRPGKILPSVQIPIPHPRTLDDTFTPEFAHIVHSLRTDISQETDPWKWDAPTINRARHALVSDPSAQLFSGKRDVPYSMFPNLFFPSPPVIAESLWEWRTLIALNSLQTFQTTMGGFRNRRSGGVLLGSAIGVSKIDLWWGLSPF